MSHWIYHPVWSKPPFAVIVFDNQPSHLLSFQKVSGPESLGRVTMWARNATPEVSVEREVKRKERRPSNTVVSTRTQILPTEALLSQRQDAYFMLNCSM